MFQWSPWKNYHNFPGISCNHCSMLFFGDKTELLKISQFGIQFVGQSQNCCAEWCIRKCHASPMALCLPTHVLKKKKISMPLVLSLIVCLAAIPTNICWVKFFQFVLYQCVQLVIRSLGQWKAAWFFPYLFLKKKKFFEEFSWKKGKVSNYWRSGNY